ncbi:Haemolysin-type calcium binding protein related domain-containing protein [Burkholderia sp. GAS332]|nr:Haemolysin-type calcium binding protein related domain-containing protein [Burkholderia sp. GAS332]
MPVPGGWVGQAMTDSTTLLHDTTGAATDASNGNSDAGTAATDGGMIAGDLNSLAGDFGNGSSGGTGAPVTAALARGAGAIKSANQAAQNLQYDSAAPTQYTDPEAYAAQIHADQTALVRADAQVLISAGIVFVAADQPYFGILLQVWGLMLDYNEVHDPYDISQIAGLIAQFFNSGGPPPGGASTGADDDAKNLFGDGGREIDPVVLDLSGNGINLTSLAGSPTYFDFANTGFAQQTSWVGAGTGILCLDPNGAAITSSGQLIESFAQLQQLSGGAQVIDASNPLFSELRVWVADSATGNTAGEGSLYTLAQLGIVSINLAAIVSNQSIDGNAVNYVSSFTLSDGSSHEIAAVSLDQNTTATIPDTAVVVPASIASLPQVAGAGTVRDLQSAMTLDATLATLVENFADLPASTSLATITSDVEAIMYEWAGVAGVDPASRGKDVDARQLEFVESFLGEQFSSIYGSNPLYHAYPDVDAAWNDLYTSVFSQLVLQSPALASLVPEFQYENGAITADQSLASLQSAYTRLGDVTASNVSQWELVLTVADAYRLQAGLSLTGYEAFVSLFTNDTIGSLANVIASNLQVAIIDGGIVEAGTPLNDTFYAGQGITELIGNGGGETFDDPSTQHDTFVYNKGDGSVDIDEGDTLSLNPTNTLQFGAGITAADVTVSLSGDNVVLSLTDGSKINLYQMDDSIIMGVQFITFADGTIWSRSQILAQVGQAAGATRYDYLQGTSGADLLDGGVGNVYVVGNGGNDTFVFDQGYGKLEINEVAASASDSNILQFGSGITASEVSVVSDRAGDAILTVGSNGDQITIDGMFSNTADGVQEVVFADGTVWTKQELLAAELATATTGADVLYGSSSAEYFDGKGGNDLEVGGGGGDTFVFDKGYGSLEINEFETAGNTNTLVLGAGISPSSINVRATSMGDIVLTDGTTGDTIQLDGMFSSSGNGVQQIEFADGTVWTRQQIIQAEMTGTSGSDSIYGTSGSDLIDGKGGDDFETGGGGNDTFVFNAGYGNLEISEFDFNGNRNNVLQLGAGISATSLSAHATSDGTGLVLTDGIAGDQITIDDMLSSAYDGVQEVVFADGTSLSASQLSQMASAISGTTGNDTLTGSVSADLFDGKGGNDVEIGNGGSDTFIFNAGYGHLEIDEPSYGWATPVLELGEGISEASLQVRATANGTGLVVADGVTGDQITLDGMLESVGSGVRQVQLADGTTLTAAQLIQMETTGTTGNDTLYGTPGAELFDGKGGNDLEIGQGGNDTFVFNAGYGKLEINESDPGRTPQNVLELGAGISESSLQARATADGLGLVLTDGVAGDQITLDDMLWLNGAGVEEVQFADGTTWSAAQLVLLETTGTTGNDTLYGTGGANLFDGKGGNDLEVGKGGNDTFVFNAGYGALEINEVDDSSTAANVLQLGAGINEASVQVKATSNGTGLVLTDGVAGDQITLDNVLWLNGSGVEEVQFADGTTWSGQQLIQLETTGTTGNDSLYGTPGADYFDGKGGNDFESGNGGNDTFVFDAGYGDLEIGITFAEDPASPVLLLGPGINESSLQVKATADGTGLVLTDGIAGDQITLDDMLSMNMDGLQTVKFADGTSLSAAQLTRMETTGTTGNDTLYGADVQVNLFDGKGGNDVEIGGGGNDTFVFDAGYGQLTINENYSWSSSIPVLELGKGISEASMQVKASADGGGIVLTDGITGDQITLQNMLDRTASGVKYGVEQVQFADGTTWTAAQLIQMETTGTTGNDSLYGTQNADLFDGKGGNDYESGGGGSDTFIFNAGYGQLEINEYYFGSALPVLEFGAGISESDLTVRGNSANGLVVTDGIAGDQITLDGMLPANGGGVSEVQFADGTTWSAAQLAQMALTGTTGNDTLYGTSGADRLDGKGGNDVEIGRGGSDTFVFNAGYGHLEVEETYADSYVDSALQLGAGIVESSVRVSATADGTGLVLTDGVSGDQITLDSMLSNASDGVELVQFADGTAWSRQQLIQMETTGTTGNDTLYGTAGADLFDGKGGNDVEIGDGGNDTFVFNAGYGELEINETDDSSTAANVLQLGAGISESSVTVASVGNNVVVTDGVSGDQITLDAMLTNSSDGVQEVQFADGTVWTAQQLLQKIPPVAAGTVIYGTSGNDTLTGTPSAEVFDGKGGNDLEIGQGGGDTFIFNPGYGQLEIEEGDTTNAVNTLQLGAGISESSITLTATRQGALVITDGIAGDQITVDDGVLGNLYGIINAGVEQVQFADGTTWSLNQILQKVNVATTGSDALFGGSGADLIDGKGGNDFEYGGGGGDTFVFNPGYGQLEILEEESHGATNVLQLGDGISKSSLQVKATSDGYGLVLSDGVSGDQITIDDMLLAPSVYGIEQVTFADGTTLSIAQLFQMETTGTTGNDTLYGTSGTDVFDGKGGNDVEYGKGGDDTYVMQAGYGTQTIVNGVYSGAAAGDLAVAGVNPDELWLQRVGNDLQVDIMGSKTEATIQNWFTYTASQLSELTVSGGTAGNLTLDTQINGLVQAMATFSANNTGFDPTSSSNPVIPDPTVLAAVNTAWHH